MVLTIGARGAEVGRAVEGGVAVWKSGGLGPWFI